MNKGLADESESVLILNSTYLQVFLSNTKSRCQGH